jgi:hypothetical protein
VQRASKPINWRIAGVTDALDGSMAPRGSMQSLTNLIPDPSTRNIWTCRPASTKFGNIVLAGGTADTISTAKLSGSIVYGMIKQTTGPLAGFDVPFAWNLATNLQVTVTGTQSVTTCPTSQPTSGAWIPPQMDLIGVKMMVAHPGFGAGGNFVGWFDLTTPTAPVWNAGQLTGGFVTFLTPPIAVKQFFNRAYYIVNVPGAPAVIFSDALNATNVTNANQVLTFGDNTPLTALGALPLNNELGGIVQALMVFKNTSNIFQITGDAGLNNLFVNALNVATGTLAPNSITPTPKGLVFMAPDGMRLINFTGVVQDPIGYEGQGMTIPFVFSAQPTRVDAACNGNLLRVSTQNGNIPIQPQQDWWFDFGKGCWTGPHTFPAALALAYQQTFIIAPIGVVGSLWQSNFIQYSSSGFVENGVQMQWTAQTTLLPDTDMITNNTITEGSIDMAMPPTQTTVSVSFNNQNNSPIAGVAINPMSSGAPAIWGSVNWGAFLWGGGGQAAITPFQLRWPLVMTFVRGSLLAQSNSVLGFKLSTIHLRYQPQRSLVSMGLAA